jgi:hypothetical protein
MRAALFQLPQDITQRIFRPDHVHTSSKDLYKTPDSNLVARIDENEILDKQQSNNVVLYLTSVRELHKRHTVTTPSSESARRLPWRLHRQEFGYNLF